MIGKILNETNHCHQNNSNLYEIFSTNKKVATTKKIIIANAFFISFSSITLILTPI